MAKPPLIAILTDFGTDDPFVGVMKGVIASICPEARVIDLTHAIRPQEIREGAFHLERSLNYFPEGTIFLCVVDPGVGTFRRPIGVEAGPFRFVAPDNGLLTPVFDLFPDARCHALADPAYHLPAPSATFHGRDIFSPVAAHLAGGLPLEKTGPGIPLYECVRIERSIPEQLDNGTGWRGEVVSIDRFGNIVTSLEASLLAGGAAWSVCAGNVRNLPVVGTYGDVQPGEPLAYAGSSGMIEIAVRNGDAAMELDIDRNSPILLLKA
jgi:S-adenosyl-L-methionine hydrolase (adenosine-forming)